jgi:branched-chain amino acid transport system substrate-binding protein
MEPVRPADNTAKRMSRARLVGIVVVVVAVVVVMSASAAVLLLGRPSGNFIKIGLTLGLTGRYSVEANAALNGILTAIDWVNEQGGVTVQGTSYQLQAIYYDDQSVSTNMDTLYAKLVQQDGAHFLLAPYSSTLTTAAAPIAEQLDRVMMSHGGASDVLWTKGYKNLVGVLSPASAYLRIAVDTIPTSPAPRVAALYEGDPFSKVAGAAAVAYAQSRGLEVVFNAEYLTGVTDLSTPLSLAREAGADVLIGGGHFNDGLLIMTQLGQLGWTPRFISLLVAITEPDFHNQLEARANRVTGPSQWEAPVKYNASLAAEQGVDWYGPTPAQFVERYRARTDGKSPSYHAAEAAAAILVLAEAVDRADSFGTAAVREVLGDMTLMTFFGDFDVDDTGIQIAHDMILIQWQDGALKIVAPAEVAEASPLHPYTGT